MSWTRSPRSPWASGTGWTGSRSTRCRPRSSASPGWSRCTRHCPAGSTPSARCGGWPTCRPRPAPTSTVSSLLRYPLFMRFFSTPEKLEIGGVPFVASEDKPTRREALTYYRKVAEYFELDVRQYHTVERVTPETGGFELVARHPGAAEPEIVGARNIVCATGFFDSPNLLGVPGEDLPHVSHFFTEPHPYWQQSVIVVGGGNSAVEA